MIAALFAAALAADVHRYAVVVGANDGLPTDDRGNVDAHALVGRHSNTGW